MQGLNTEENLKVQSVTEFAERIGAVAANEYVRTVMDAVMSIPLKRKRTGRLTRRVRSKYSLKLVLPGPLSDAEVQAAFRKIGQMGWLLEKKNRKINAGDTAWRLRRRVRLARAVRARGR